MQDTVIWTFQIYLFVLFYAVLSFMTAALLFPPHLDKDADYETYFLDRRAWFFGLQIINIMVDYADSWLKGADHFASLGPEYVIASIIQIVACGVGIATRNIRYHWVLAIGMLVYQLSWALRQFGTMV